MPSEAKTARSRRTRAALVAAVHERLALRGAFTAEEIAREVGCTPATFWSHFGTKDDAITAAFSTALEHLVELTETLFGAGPSGLQALASERRKDREAWALHSINELLTYFGRRSLLFRAALARLHQHRELRRVFRHAEDRTLEIVARGLGARRPRADALVVVSFCQGLSNPMMLEPQDSERVRRGLARGLYALTFDL